MDDEQLTEAKPSQQPSLPTPPPIYMAAPVTEVKGVPVWRFWLITASSGIIGLLFGALIAGLITYVMMKSNSDATCELRQLRGIMMETQEDTDAYRKIYGKMPTNRDERKSYLGVLDQD